MVAAAAAVEKELAGGMHCYSLDWRHIGSVHSSRPPEEAAVKRARCSSVVGRLGSHRLEKFHLRCSQSCYRAGNWHSGNYGYLGSSSQNTV